MRPDTLITVLFAAIVPAFSILPWIESVEGSQVALSGVGLSFGQYNAQPSEYFALAAVAIAVVGAVVPHLMRRNKTITRTCLAIAGASVLALMQMHTPMGLQSIVWGAGYWISLALFVVTAFVSVYTLGRVHQRTGSRIWRRRR